MAKAAQLTSTGASSSGTILGAEADKYDEQTVPLLHRIIQRMCQSEDQPAQKRTSSTSGIKAQKIPTKDPSRQLYSHQATGVLNAQYGHNEMKREERMLKRSKGARSICKNKGDKYDISFAEGIIR